VTSTSIYQYQEPRRLHGTPGIVYVLTNTSLKENIVRVGLSRRSGWAKALELNRDKTNTLPGSYDCIFEIQAQDGGAVIEAILKELQNYQFGKKEQNFFRVDIDILEEIVTRTVTLMNQHVKDKYQQATKMREYLADTVQEENANLIEQENRKEQINDRPNKSAVEIHNEMNQHRREGIFNRANIWVNKILN
jgi:hypothetical protein